MEPGYIIQTKEDFEFGKEDIWKGLSTGIYQDVTPEHAYRALEAAALISSAFLVWKEKDSERLRQFVFNLSVQSNHLCKGSVHMETLSDFAMSVPPEDHMISFEIEKAFRHLRLYPAMRDWFIFQYDGRYYQCGALPFFGVAQRFG